jgi:hypothetical protein
VTVTLPGLDHDAVVVKRPGTAVDAEGNPTKALTTVLTTVGTWGSPSYRDVARAQQGGQVIDAVVAMETADVRIGDRVTVRTKDYTVTTVADTRFHMRLGLRRVE